MPAHYLIYMEICVLKIYPKGMANLKNLCGGNISQTVLNKMASFAFKTSKIEYEMGIVIDSSKG